MDCEDWTFVRLCCGCEDVMADQDPTLSRDVKEAKLKTFGASFILNHHVHWLGTFLYSVSIAVLKLTSKLFKVEHLGTVSSIEHDEGGYTLTISDSAAILGDCHLGDSIAVNGACLTVTEFNPVQDGGYFKVFLANETLARTDHGIFLFMASKMSNLTYSTGDREVGEKVNLERAMAANARFGGHFVQVRKDKQCRLGVRLTLRFTGSH